MYYLMNIFQKKSSIKPKKLSLREMWELYRLLGDGNRKTYLFDEIVSMMETMPPENIKESIKLMYTNIPLNPLEIGLMFAKGLKHNEFFGFQEFIKAINGSSK